MTGAAGARGHTLVGLVQALGVLAVLIALGAIELAPAAGMRTAEAGARALAACCARLGVRAVAEGRAVGLAFPVDADEPLVEITDANGDGLHRADVSSGRDPAGPAFSLDALVAGARIGRPPWDSASDLPGRGGQVTPADPAVRFGRARLVTFDPEGHATGGSVFVTDGAGGLCAVVVNGATARVSTWCYQRRSDSWQRR